ncbi:MAG: hypothetical protein ACI9JN_000753 [Bacteroidia bacterium]|jgi:hypothetical protein
MKIRINGDTIRLRLSQTEVAEIGKFNPVAQTTDFGDTQFTYSLDTHITPLPISATYADNHMRISINQNIAALWANSDEVGISSNAAVKPSILIEKDFQCLTVRAGEDESDLFENPNTNC